MSLRAGSKSSRKTEPKSESERMPRSWQKRAISSRSMAMGRSAVVMTGLRLTFARTTANQTVPGINRRSVRRVAPSCDFDEPSIDCVTPSDRRAPATRNFLTPSIDFATRSAQFASPGGHFANRRARRAPRRSGFVNPSGHGSSPRTLPSTPGSRCASPRIVFSDAYVLHIHKELLRMKASSKNG